MSKREKSVDGARGGPGGAGGQGGQGGPGGSDGQGGAGGKGGEGGAGGQQGVAAAEILLWLSNMETRVQAIEKQLRARDRTSPADTKEETS